MTPACKLRAKTLHSVPINRPVWLRAPVQLQHLCLCSVSVRKEQESQRSDWRKLNKWEGEGGLQKLQAAAVLKIFQPRVCRWTTTTRCRGDPRIFHFIILLLLFFLFLLCFLVLPAFRPLMPFVGRVYAPQLFFVVVFWDVVGGYRLSPSSVFLRGLVFARWRVSLCSGE